MRRSPAPVHSFPRALALALFIAAFAVVIFITAGAARSEEQLRCGPWPRVVANASRLFGEVPIGGGLLSEKAIIQVLASPNGETFSIFAVDANGYACMVAAGFGWDPGQTPPPPPSGQRLP